MASIDIYHGKRGASYRVQWREKPDEGPVRRETRTLPTELAASRFKSLVEASGNRLPRREVLKLHDLDWLLGPAESAPEKSITVAALVEAYIAYLRGSSRGRSPETLRLYERQRRNHITSLPLGSMDATRVTWREVEAWQKDLADLALVGTTIGSTRCLLSSAFKWGAGKGEKLPRIPNPVADAEGPRAAPKVKDILYDPAEYQTYLSIAEGLSPRFGRLAALLAVTGLRISEATNLAPADGDLDRHTITIRSQLKHGPVRRVPVPVIVTEQILRPAVEAGGRWLLTDRGRQWDRHRVRSFIRKANHELALAGLRRHITPHSFRYGYSTWLGTHAIEHDKRAILLGHRKPTMTGHYTLLSDADLAQVRDLVEPLVKYHLT